jgi:glycine betaine/proline transport system permease protein
MTTVSVSLGRGADIRLSRGQKLALLLGAWALLYLLFNGRLTIEHSDDAQLFTTLNGVRDWVDANRTSAPIFVYLLDPVRDGIGWLIDALTWVFSNISWLGITAIFGAMGFVFVGWRTALLVIGSFVAFGLLSLWDQAIQTLVLILVAVVLSLAIGIPLGIVAGRSDRFLKVVTPILDVMQIMPTFAYLSPLTLIFLIGPPAATIATMIYALPPAIRITAMGIRGVSAETVEAADSLGSTGFQVLRKVQLPMARSTIGLAVNQTIMMALAMVVITALINAPGLGESIIQAIIKLNLGQAFDAGVAIVLLAMVLDRLSARASSVSDRRHRGFDPVSIARRRMLVVGTWLAAGIVVVGAAILSIPQSFPADINVDLASPINSIGDWIETNLYVVTGGIKDVFSQWVLDPLQTVLTSSPWPLVIVMAAGIAWIISGRRAAIASAIALLLVVGLQLWEHSMETLALVIVAVAVTMVIGITLGVMAARSNLFSAIIRPINDAAQTMPAFVYILPAVALFGPTRFTGILAAVIYAVPAVVRLVEDGVRGVSPTVIEAATAAGSSRLQMIFKVQLPMARRSLLLATNQGVVLVLAMVVVAGLVGAGALGYDVVAGFAQFDAFGEGMAAAVSIVLLGVLLDRITQGAGARTTTASAARTARAFLSARAVGNP